MSAGPWKPLLRGEVRDLVLVAAGAIPGALLRWQLEQIGHHAVGGLRGLTAADLLANLIGCLLIGVLTAQPPGSQRLYLWAGIGFCGSLTTFSSWMLQLAEVLRRGSTPAALAVLLVSLGAGLALVVLGSALGRRLGARRGR